MSRTPNTPINIPREMTTQPITGAEFDRRQAAVLGNAASREALENDPLNGFLNPGVSARNQAMSRLTHNILTEHARSMSHPAAREAAEPQRAVAEDNPGLAVRWAGSIKQAINARRDAKAQAAAEAADKDPLVLHTEKLNQEPPRTGTPAGDRLTESSVKETYAQLSPIHRNSEYAKVSQINQASQEQVGQIQEAEGPEDKLAA